MKSRFKYIMDPANPGRVIPNPEHPSNQPRSPSPRKPHKPPTKSWRLPDHAAEVFQVWSQNRHPEHLRRLSLAQHPEDVKERFLRELQEVVPSRFNTKTNSREFLLRRVGDRSRPHTGHPEGLQYNHATEWSTEPQPGENSAAAWVPEHKIAFIPAIAAKHGPHPWVGDPYHVIAQPMVVHPAGFAGSVPKDRYRRIRPSDHRQALDESAPEKTTEAHHVIPVAENVDWSLRNLFGAKPPLKDIPKEQHRQHHADKNRGLTNEERSAAKKLAASENWDLVDLTKHVFHGSGFGISQGPTPEYHGFITPQGEFIKLENDESHSQSVARHFHGEHSTYGSDYAAYAAGYIACGHGGDPNFTGHHKILSNPDHPATKRLMSIVGKHVREPMYVSVLGHPHGTGESGDKSYWRADPRHFAATGELRESWDLAASEKRNPDLEKHLYGEQGASVRATHGIITPEGEHIPMPGHVGHRAKIFELVQKKYPHIVEAAKEIPNREVDYYSAAKKHGFICLNHAGSNLFSVHKDVFEDKYHPAMEKLRELIGDHYHNPIDIAITGDGLDPQDEQTYSEIDPQIFAKTGRLISMNLAASERPLTKEMYGTGRIPPELHGLISPEGKVIGMESGEVHGLALKPHIGGTENPDTNIDVALDNGWITMGHAGEPAFLINEGLHHPGHPAVLSLKRLIKRNRHLLPDTVEVNGGQVDTDTIMKYGKFIHPMSKSLVHLRPSFVGVSPTPEKDSIMLPKMKEPDPQFPWLPVETPEGQRAQAKASKIITQSAVDAGAVSPENRDLVEDQASAVFSYMRNPASKVHGSAGIVEGERGSRATPTFVNQDSYGSGHSPTEHHEGFHRMHHQIIEKYGKEVATEFLNELISKAPGNVKEYVTHVSKSGNYSTKPGAFHDEFFPQLITLASMPEMRKALLEHVTRSMQRGEPVPSYIRSPNSNTMSFGKYYKLVRDAKNLWNSTVKHINSLPRDYFEKRLQQVGASPEKLAASELNKAVFCQGKIPITFHGIIDHEGNFHQMQAHETHGEKLNSLKLFRNRKDCILVGHGGEPCATIHDQVFKAHGHPAMRKFRALLEAHPQLQSISISHIPEGGNEWEGNVHNVEADRLLTGKFNPSMKMSTTAMFKSQEMPYRIYLASRSAGLSKAAPDTPDNYFHIYQKGQRLTHKPMHIDHISSKLFGGKSKEQISAMGYGLVPMTSYGKYAQAPTRSDAQLPPTTPPPQKKIPTGPLPPRTFGPPKKS